jgi:hypothetical protein
MLLPYAAVRGGEMGGNFGTYFYFGTFCAFSISERSVLDDVVQQVGGHTERRGRSTRLHNHAVRGSTLIHDIDSKTSHFVLFLQVLSKQGLRSLWAVAHLYSSILRLGVFCWSYYAEGLVAITQWINDTMENILSSSVV